MFKEEIKQTIDSLGQEELVYAEAYIKARNLASDPLYREKIGNTLREMKEGKVISSADVREISDLMDEKGL